MFVLEINLRRLPAARPNHAFINTASVSSLNATSFAVTLVPFECGYDFPLFELANGGVCANYLNLIFNDIMQ